MPKYFNHVQHGIELEPLTRETRETGRVYFAPNGATYPSVTTVLSILSKDGIQAWRDRIGEKEADKILKQAGRRGTAVHDLCEQYLKNCPDYSSGAMPFHMLSFQPLKAFLDQHVDNIWYQEQFLWSEYLQTAGQVDLIAEFDGELAIIDFKTSRKPKKKEYIKSYFMQEAFYAVAFEERTQKPIRKCVTLITVDGAEPQVFIENRDDHIHDFIQLRKQYKQQKGI